MCDITSKEGVGKCTKKMHEIGIDVWLFCKISSTNFMHQRTCLDFAGRHTADNIVIKKIPFLSEDILAVGRVCVENKVVVKKEPMNADTVRTHKCKHACTSTHTLTHTHTPRKERERGGGGEMRREKGGGGGKEGESVEESYILKIPTFSFANSSNPPPPKKKRARRCYLNILTMSAGQCPKMILQTIRANISTYKTQGNGSKQ